MNRDLNICILLAADFLFYGGLVFAMGATAGFTFGYIRGSKRALAENEAFIRRMKE